MIKKYLGAAGAGLALLLASASSSAKVIDFEDLTFSPSGAFGGVDLYNRYGLNFVGGRFNISTLAVTSYSGWGAHSGNNYARGDGYFTPIEISGKDISLNSFWVRGGITMDDGEITVRAFKNHNLVGSKTFNSTPNYQLETFNFGYVDNIVITSAGSPGILLDDVDIGFATPVPEPGSYAMLMGGLGLLLAARRQKRS